MYLIELKASISRLICTNLALRMSSALSDPSVKESIDYVVNGEAITNRNKVLSLKLLSF